MSLDPDVVEQAVEFVERWDAMYRTPKDGVDLLAMSKRMPEETFRRYITCCRIIRAYRRM